MLKVHDGWFIFFLVYLKYWHQRLDDMEYFESWFLILTQFTNMVVAPKKFVSPKAVCLWVAC